MIEVELPDGTVVEFPEGTTNAVMQNAIRLHLGPPALPRPDQPSAAAPLTPTQRQTAALRSGEPVAIPGFEPGTPPSAQSTLDMTIQSLLTAGGMAAGSFAGPPGTAIGGGLGASAGKRIARDIGSLFNLSGSEEYPSTTETAVDAGLGAAGPAVSAVAKPVARAVSGVSRKTADVLDRLHKGKGDLTRAAKEAADEAEVHAAKMAENPFGSAIEMASGKSSQARWEALKRQAQSTGERFTRVEKELRDRVLKTIEDTGHLPKKGGDFIAALQLVSSGDPVSAAAIFGAGRALSKARMKAAKVLLNDERWVEWMAKRAEGGITPSGLLTSLSGLAAQKGIAPETKQAIRTLQGEEESEGMRGDRDALQRMMDGDR